MGFLGSLAQFIPFTHNTNQQTNVEVTQANKQVQAIDFKPVLANLNKLQGASNKNQEGLIKNQSILASNQQILGELIGLDITKTIKSSIPKENKAKKSIPSAYSNNNYAIALIGLILIYYLTKR